MYGKNLTAATTTMEKCRDFINKGREFRLIKIRDKQINKFNRVMGYKDRKTTAQPSANNYQSQSPNDSTKWVINLP